MFDSVPLHTSEALLRGLIAIDSPTVGRGCLDGLGRALRAPRLQSAGPYRRNAKTHSPTALGTPIFLRFRELVRRCGVSGEGAEPVAATCELLSESLRRAREPLDLQHDG